MAREDQYSSMSGGPDEWADTVCAETARFGPFSGGAQQKTHSSRVPRSIWISMCLGDLDIGVSNWTNLVGQKPQCFMLVDTIATPSKNILSHPITVTCVFSEEVLSLPSNGDLPAPNSPTGSGRFRVAPGSACARPASNRGHRPGRPGAVARASRVGRKPRQTSRRALVIPRHSMGHMPTLGWFWGSM